MEKITVEAIKSAVAILIGVGAIAGFKEVLGGTVLIAVGLILFGVNPDLRNLVLSFVKLMEYKIDKIFSKETQNQESSPGAVQQQVKSGRNSITAGGDITAGGSIIIHGEQRTDEPKAKLELYFDEKETYHIRSLYNTNPLQEGLFLHVMVKNTSDVIAKNCYGELVEVQELKDETYSRAEAFAPVDLGWAHKGLVKMDIDKALPRPLDICSTTEGSDLFAVMTDSRPNGIQKQFPKGTYKIKVRVTGENTGFSYGYFLIEFDGNWKNIKMRPAV